VTKPNWFVAAPIPAADWLPDVLADLPASCRGFQPEDVHLTVAFLGAMDPDRREAVAAAMDRVAAAPLHIRLGALLALPSPKRPSAFSFSVTQGAEAATGLIGDWRESLWAAAGARADTRPPLAHITVARPIRKFGPRGQREGMDWMRGVAPPDGLLIIDRLALYTWAEDRRLRQFQIVHQRPLRP